MQEINWPNPSLIVYVWSLWHNGSVWGTKFVAQVSFLIAWLSLCGENLRYMLQADSVYINTWVLHCSCLVLVEGTHKFPYNHVYKYVCNNYVCDWTNKWTLLYFKPQGQSLYIIFIWWCMFTFWYIPSTLRLKPIPC